MTNPLVPQAEYEVRRRRISGTGAEKLQQIDAAIQELLDIRALECLAGTPNVQVLTVPRPRSHALAMTVTILVLFIALVLLIGVRASHAQDAVGTAAAPPWHAVGTLDVSFLNSTNDRRMTCSGHAVRRRRSTSSASTWQWSG